jgi:hypothetical protein
MTPQRPPSVYRLHVSTSSDDRHGTFQYLLDHDLVAVGWGAGPTDHSWESYQQVAASDDWYGEVDSSVRRMHDASERALVWMRDVAGAYYLARIDGPWRYLNDGTNADLDLWNARPATIKAVGVESRVPGKVANSFIRGQAFRHIRDEAALQFTHSLWETLNGQPPSYKPTLDDVLRTLLGAQDLEDLVAVYLQRVHGYLVLPASRRPDTPAYEYVLRHPDTGEEAVVQVKTGTSPVPRDGTSLPTSHVDRVFVFSPTASYSGRRAKNVTELGFEDLVRFMHEQPTCLPPLVEHWTRMANHRPNSDSDRSIAQAQ